MTGTTTIQLDGELFVIEFKYISEKKGNPLDPPTASQVEILSAEKFKDHDDGETIPCDDEDWWKLEADFYEDVVRQVEEHLERRM